jgi:hypothetical protein
MSKNKPASKVSSWSKRRGHPAREWPERIDADPEDVMRVLMRTPRDQIREEPVDYKAEPPKGSE